MESPKKPVDRGQSSRFLKYSGMAMQMLGRDSGEMRLPVVEVSEATKKLIAENLKKLGLL